MFVALAAAGSTIQLPNPRDGACWKRKALDYLQSLTRERPAPSFLSNTPSEDAILDYAEHFRRQFVQLFPERSPLLIAPLNECQVRVCRNSLHALSLPSFIFM